MTAGDWPNADIAAEAFVETFGLFARALVGGRVTHGPYGVTAVVSGVPAATLNGVWAMDASADADGLHAVLDDVAALGIPHCLQARPAGERVSAAVADERGMVATPPIPLMTMAGAPTVDARGELSIRRLRPDEAARHAEVAAPAFEAPYEVFATAITPATLCSTAVRAYLGELDGRPVVTAVAATLGERLGIFNVATVPEARGRGYGAAVTARAIRDGLDAGARWSWLQSAEAAVPLYERLGFRTLERWPCWLAG